MESHCERVVLTRRGLCSTIPLLSLSPLLPSLASCYRALHGLLVAAGRSFGRALRLALVFFGSATYCVLCSLVSTVSSEFLGLGSVEKQT